MKDVIVKNVRSKIASSIISINGNEYEVNSIFSVLSKTYNNMYDKDLSFFNLIEKYINQCNDKEKLTKLKNMIELKI